MSSPNDQPPHSDAVEQSLSPSPESSRAALSPRSAASASKVVFAEPESISPLMEGKHKELDQSDTLDLDKSSKKHRVRTAGKRLSGRPSIERLGSSSKASLVGNPSVSSLLTEDSDLSNASPKERQHHHEKLMKQVSAWLKHEKARRAARKAKRKTATEDTPRDIERSEHALTDQAAKSDTDQTRRGSESSEGSVALEQLANILERTLSLKSNEGSPKKRRSSHAHKLSGIMKRHHSTVSSDTDYFESADDFVPSAEAVLDNSKTLAYGGGGPEMVADSGASIKSNRSRRTKQKKEAWATFKYEIVRITHTLKLKGWRRVPLELSGQIDVKRLSGAMTNAVYVVSPPADLHTQKEKESGPPAPRNPPPKLLLRIYGPQVEHLIDREAELKILRRLARKRIGPRLLGTFKNGRFEEFFHAQTLTFDDLRVPDTSRQIAKRMRELHEGIDLLSKERDDGPFVWRNWDKWVDRCEQIVTWLDRQVLENKCGEVSSTGDSWKKRGLVLGVEWPVFRRTIEKYRGWLESQYGGLDILKERLVFAHNDAQYGNILRLVPAGESPLLLPANEHKQLVVIDFEYANANLPGLEFANHFTEWAYNYHSDVPYLCSTKYYPTPEEQHNFLRAYLMHNPTVRVRGDSNPPTPHLGPLPHSASSTALTACAPPSSISAFMLDARAPPGESYSYQEQEAQVEQKTDQEIQRLMAETRLWRLANSAQWTAWGIVQAHIPGLPNFDEEEDGDKTPTETETKQGLELDSATAETKAEAEQEDGGEAAGEGEGEGEGEDEEFDYLGYVQERALFAWGDAIQLGIIKAEELPEDLRKRVKIVEY